MTQLNEMAEGAIAIEKPCRLELELNDHFLAFGAFYMFIF